MGCPASLELVIKKYFQVKGRFGDRDGPLADPGKGGADCHSAQMAIDGISSPCNGLAPMCESRRVQTTTCSFWPVRSPLNSGDVKGTITDAVRYLFVPNDVRRHRLISISYMSLLPCHGRRQIDFQIRLNLDPFMIHETFLCLTETAFGSHPCRVVSVTYRKLRPFHGADAGSNPAGDAKSIT